MPRLGSRKSRGAVEAPALAAALAVAHAEATTGLPDELRDSLRQAAADTLERVHKIQRSTRDKKGRIRRAKFKAAVLNLRWEGFGPKQTSEILGVAQARVDDALRQMRDDASIDGQLNRLDNIIVPLAIDNVARGVMNGDKEYTLKVLDGRGVFRSFKSLDAQVKKTVLTLKITAEMPAHLAGVVPVPKPGAIVGAALPPQLAPAPERSVVRDLPANTPESL